MLKNKPQRTSNKILEGHVPLAPDHYLLGWGQRNNSVYTNGKNGDGRVLPRVLLDDGQGKSPSDMDISSSESEDGQCTDRRVKSAPLGPPFHTNNNGEEHILLRPPVIEATGMIATGATTPNFANKINSIVPTLCYISHIHRSGKYIKVQLSSRRTIRIIVSIRRRSGKWRHRGLPFGIKLRDSWRNGHSLAARHGWGGIGL